MEIKHIHTGSHEYKYKHNPNKTRPTFMLSVICYPYTTLYLLTSVFIMLILNSISLRILLSVSTEPCLIISLYFNLYPSIQCIYHLPHYVPVSLYYYFSTSPSRSLLVSLYVFISLFLYSLSRSLTHSFYVYIYLSLSISLYAYFSPCVPTFIFIMLGPILYLFSLYLHLSISSSCQYLSMSLYLLNTICT